MVEGKLSIWIKGGTFTHRNDLYVQVMCDDREVWKTDESDSFNPEWDRFECCVCDNFKLISLF